ncbi:intercellular adhesion molecule 5-like [Anomalospiza imberbis]|uniref:intercellular adhesion molecule 5-like n=1 Tax=Anomalospiza imberbis TaxID=187417 RepID=UPI00358FDE03
MGAPGPATRLLPPLVLALAGVARGTFTVVAWPRVAVVAFGGSVTVNCSRSACPGDNATLGLETPLPATPGAGGAPLAKLPAPERVPVEPRPCHLLRPAAVTPRPTPAPASSSTLPERVELEPVPALAVGDSRNLTCHVLEVAPVRNLTVTLRRGAETLRTESFGDAEGSASVAVSHLLTVTRGDHGQDVTCHAELSLRPHGPLFARAAVPVTLSVFALPEPPQLQAPAILEAGTVANASCRITGAFPAGDIRVTAALDQEPLNVTATVAGDTVTASTELSPRSPGPRELSCTAAVATVARTARRQLHVYHLPEIPASGCPGNRTWVRGTREALSCRATGNPAPTVVCGRDGVAVASAEPEPVTRSRAGTYLCNATNALGTRSRRVTVRVECEWHRGRRRGAAGSPSVAAEVTGRPLCPPKMSPRCPRRGVRHGGSGWRGSGGSWSVAPTGTPGPARAVPATVAPATVAPTTAAPTTAGSPRGRVVTRADGGRYVCRATNRHGVAVRSVVVTVEYQPSLGERGCPERRRWLEGTPAELGCAATGNPPPRVTCAKLGDGRDPANATELGGSQDPPQATPNVTRAHAGTYQCRATNAHGSAVRNVTVAVEYGPAGVTLRVLPSANVTRGSGFTVDCGAEGVPAPTYTWALPPAPNLRLAADNRSVTVTGATTANRGVYTCTASNRHGRRAGERRGAGGR